MDIQNSAETCLASGRNLLDQGRYEEAILALDEGISVQPQNHLFHYWKGIAESGLGRFDLELECYDEAIRLSPHFCEAHAARGFANLCRGHFHEAITDYTTAASLAPEYIESFRQYISRAWTGRGRKFQRAGSAANALVCYRLAIEWDSSNAEAYRNRGYAYMVLEDFERAISDLDTAISLNSNDALTYLYKSYVNAKTGEYSMGVENVLRAFAIDPQFLGALGADAEFMLTYSQRLASGLFPWY